MASIWDYLIDRDKQEVTPRRDRIRLNAPPAPKAQQPMDYSTLFAPVNEMVEQRPRLIAPRFQPEQVNAENGNTSGASDRPDLTTGFYPKTKDEIPLPSVMTEITPEMLNAPRVNDGQAEQPLNLGNADSALSLGKPNLPPIVPQVSGNNQTELAPRDRWRKAEDDLYAAQNKDYSISKDEQGNVIRGKDRDKDFDWKDRLVPGLLGGLMGLLSGGGIGAGLGGAIVGLIGGQFDRNLSEKMKTQIYELPKLQQQADAARNAYKVNLDLLGAENEATIQANEDARKMQKALDDSADALMKQLISDKVFDEKDAELYEQVTGRKIKPYDLRGREVVKVGDKSFDRPNIGDEPFTETNLPRDLPKGFVGVQIPNPDGKPFITYMSSEDAARFKYNADKDRATANAQQQRFEEQKDFEEEKINFNTVKEWRQARIKAGSDVPGLQRSIAELNQSIAEIDFKISQNQGYDVSDYERTKTDLKKQKSEFERELSRANLILKSPRPQEFKRKPRQNKKRNSADPLGIYK